jgi:hypothetical protein
VALMPNDFGKCYKEELKGVSVFPPTRAGGGAKRSQGVSPIRIVLGLMPQGRTRLANPTSVSGLPRMSPHGDSSTSARAFRITAVSLYLSSPNIFDDQRMARFSR